MGARMEKMKLGGYTRRKRNANSRRRFESGGLQRNKINKKGKGDPREKQRTKHDKTKATTKEGRCGMAGRAAAWR